MAKTGKIMEKELKKKPKWITIILILLFLYLLSTLVASFFGMRGTERRGYGNIVLIRINGLVTAEGVSFLRERTISSDDIIRFIDEADENPAVKAIMFEINSPGGTAVASSEIVNRIKKLNKTTVSYIREIGVSGAYWIASATGHIIANSMSIVGSIGVYASYLELSGFLERYNITYQRLVGGKYKDMGTPLKKTTAEEKAILQKNIDELHDMFLQSIKQNRQLDDKTIEELSTALIYNGEKAYSLGLIDGIGGKDEAMDYIEKKLNITAEITEYKKTETWFSVLRGLFSEIGFNLGAGMGSGIAGSENDARVYS